ncbi:MAG: DUF2000 domain-containing protein [Alphaproteobacteria bacterium]|nr:DUF2000 domain-containing protein [Alphaproteobacteria bacterium]
MYDYTAKKVVAVLASTLEQGIAMNVLGHMCVAIGAHSEEGLMGRASLPDASGTNHVGIGRYPVIITKVKPARLRQFITEARAHKDLLLVDFPQEMLDTRHDDDLVASMAAKPEADMAYLGAIVYGDAALIQSLSGKFMLWK